MELLNDDGKTGGATDGWPTPEAATELERMLQDLLALKSDIERDADLLLKGYGLDRPLPEIVNLAHYVSLRRHDIRALQRRLMRHGLSSMGRLESRVLPTLDAVLAALAAMMGRKPGADFTSNESFFSGERRLEEATAVLLGPKPENRRGRIMVTFPSEAAEEPKFVRKLVRKGMNVARINCAHDDPDVWMAMAANVRAAAKKEGRDVRVLMDIAGPKIRTETVLSADKSPRLQEGDRFRLVLDSRLDVHPEIAVTASVSLPQMVERLRVGDRVLYDDSKLEGVVESVSEGEAVILVKQPKSGGAKIKPHKGINLPDTALGVSPLTAKDQQDLKTVIACADMVGYSFVSQPEDIDLLEEALQCIGAGDHPLGIVAKIERPEAVRNLPALIARASGRRSLAVMIARGDLASEIGFERLAEMQEEILWICEAASTPVIWATQVLESLVKFGSPSRGDMTDAAMAARAECVMLNKGPAVVEAVELLDRLVSRMEGHMAKKTPTLRALHSW
ncbi:pyruvate kinase [Roseibium aggregatum]|uniref:Pyruvate kinase n=1 Tax=Roseibium aggregatum TaxID=187304 RepID=A0A939EDM2_9HYPH|nr:pyruvate kinase [Roseibium aggregatum]MBN9669669.1 pyruvate kinase [Roseibium aggregatum]